MQRFLGFDLGNETVRVAELVDEGAGLRIGRTWSREHGKDPRATVTALLAELEWDGVDGAAATGRMAPAVRLDRIPQKAAVAEGVAVVAPEGGACTVVSIGSHGFAVIDVLEDGTSRIRENSRCSQGTGNFLRQLVERLDVSLPEADRLCEDVAEPAPLS
ncbi:MAG: CoA activase, partial [Planctomycetota bacterium]